MREDSVAIHLLPSPRDSRQVYDLSDPAEGLRRNCTLLGFSIVETSSYGKALVAQRSFDADAVVGHMWGKLVCQDVHAAMQTAPHTDPTHQEGEEDYCTPIKNGVWRTVSTGGAGQMLLVSEQCPMSLINHSDSPEQCNVSIDLTDTAYDAVAHALNAQDHWRIFEIRATRRISKGQQIYAHYGWTASDWEEMERRQQQAAR